MHWARILRQAVTICIAINLKGPYVSTHRLLKSLNRLCRNAAVACAAGALATLALAESPVRKIEVTRDGDAYVVKAEMSAPVAPALAWEVLTDFANMARWVPNVSDSRVVKPGEAKLMIEQRGTAKFSGMKFDYASLREIELDAQTTIHSTQIKGSMKKQVSLMKVSPEGAGTLMLYKLELVPSFLASAVISEDLLKQETVDQFTAIVGEMLRRKK